MTSASDKARFYLEQTVPELREWERREIFSKSEITAISSQRSSFEHIVNSREASPSVYARYIAYETNLASLARIRIKRTNLKSSSSDRPSHQHSSQKRILNLLERATRKFHGDLALWMQYVQFCRAQKANKRTARVITEMLRLFPTRGEVWTYAARWCWDRERRMSDVRGYFLRGLRFCGNTSRELWIDFARQEMVFLSVLEARRRILGLTPQSESGEKEQHAEGDVQERATDADSSADMITLPSDDAIPKSKASDMIFDEAALNSVINTPAARGAIPRSIFDQAFAKADQKGRDALRFFDMFAEFLQVPCARGLVQHVLDALHQASPKDFHLIVMECKMHLLGHEPASVAFPSALRESLRHIRESIAGTEETKQMALKKLLSSWLGSYLEDRQLGLELRTVVQASIKQLQRQ